VGVRARAEREQECRDDGRCEAVEPTEHHPAAPAEAVVRTGRAVAEPAHPELGVPASRAAAASGHDDRSGQKGSGPEVEKAADSHDREATRGVRAGEDHVG
jgi:hypothetical protein